MKKENLILITNDDGITAPGIRNLIEAVKPLGKVVVVAPDSPQSGKGHAITLGFPLRLNQVDIFQGIEAWTCSGTPVDCVKLARDKILDRSPDICVSGINHGANHSINIIYSGTMSAAMEAAIEGIPSVGFSFLNYAYDADFSVPRQVAARDRQKDAGNAAAAAFAVQCEHSRRARLGITKAYALRGRPMPNGKKSSTSAETRTAKNTTGSPANSLTKISGTIQTCGPSKTAIHPLCLYSSTLRITA